MADPFSDSRSNLSDPFEHAAAVTPDNSNDIALSGRSLYIGVTGDVKVTTVKGDTVTFKAHPVGYMPGRVRRVFATGTTATDILALW